MTTPEEIKKKNPMIPPQAIDRAFPWLANAKVTNKKSMVIVDFSLSDAKERFHFINLDTGEAEHHKVAHGKNSDQNKDNVPDHFSNVSGSFQSSLGAMVINEEVKSNHYKVVHLMTGLEKGVNDHVRERAILWHSAAYVDDGTKAPSGDTLGCFGMAVATAQKLNKLVTGCLLFAWHPSLEGTKVEVPSEPAGDTYKEGGFGPVVERIQRVVGAVVDGLWGPQTTELVKRWQGKMALTPDGIAGPRTLKAMGVLEAPKEETPVIVSPGNPALGIGENPFGRGSVPWYEFLYKSLKFDAGTESKILANTKVLLAGKARYLKLQDQTRVPWTTIAALHMMEGSCDFATYLGNGQSLNRVTTIVPKGRGPFPTFEAGALDALKLDGLTNVLNWTLGLELKYGEVFNGMGYFKYHTKEFSPYLWACSNINDGTGKYTSDGHYDENANANAQVGVATMFKQLEIMGEYKPVFLSDAK